MAEQRFRGQNAGTAIEDWGLSFLPLVHRLHSGRALPTRPIISIAAPYVQLLPADGSAAGTPPPNSQSDSAERQNGPGRRFRDGGG